MAVIASAGISVTYPLIYRRIINDGILHADTTLIVRLAMLIGMLGVLDAALGLAQTYLGTRIGADVVVAHRAPGLTLSSSPIRRSRRGHVPESDCT